MSNKNASKIVLVGRSSDLDIMFDALLKAGVPQENILVDLYSKGSEDEVRTSIAEMVKSSSLLGKHFEILRPNADPCQGLADCKCGKRPVICFGGECLCATCVDERLHKLEQALLTLDNEKELFRGLLEKARVELVSLSSKGIFKKAPPAVIKEIEKALVGSKFEAVLESLEKCPGGK
ncbi:MAG: hypothetical protein WC824_09820 [Bacteroidota bacterium]|jgi:hypothetical protein